MERLLARPIPRRAEPDKKAQRGCVHHAQGIHGGVIHDFSSFLITADHSMSWRIAQAMARL